MGGGGFYLYGIALPSIETYVSGRVVGAEGGDEIRLRVQGEGRKMYSCLRNGVEGVFMTPRIKGMTRPGQAKNLVSAVSVDIVMIVDSFWEEAKDDFHAGVLRFWVEIS